MRAALGRGRARRTRRRGVGRTRGDDAVTRASAPCSPCVPGRATASLARVLAVEPRHDRVRALLPGPYDRGHVIRSSARELTASEATTHASAIGCARAHAARAGAHARSGEQTKGPQPPNTASSGAAAAPSKDRRRLASCHAKRWRRPSVARVARFEPAAIAANARRTRGARSPQFSRRAPGLLGMRFAMTKHARERTSPRDAGARRSASVTYEPRGSARSASSGSCWPLDALARPVPPSQATGRALWGERADAPRDARTARDLHGACAVDERARSVRAREMSSLGR